MAVPTPANPWVTRDGFTDVWVWAARAWAAEITYPDLADPIGWDFRIGFAATPGGTVLASGSIEDGSITVAPAEGGGTRISIVVPDETMAGITIKKGAWDLVAEDPGGDEWTLFAGKFYAELAVVP